MKIETKHTVCGLEVIWDTDMETGKIAIHPETLAKLWRETDAPITLQAGVPPTGDGPYPIGVGSRHPR